MGPYMFCKYLSGSKGNERRPKAGYIIYIYIHTPHGGPFRARATDGPPVFKRN